MFGLSTKTLLRRLSFFNYLFLIAKVEELLNLVPDPERGDGGCIQPVGSAGHIGVDEAAVGLVGEG